MNRQTLMRYLDGELGFLARLRFLAGVAVRPGVRRELASWQSLSARLQDLGQDGLQVTARSRSEPPRLSDA